MGATNRVHQGDAAGRYEEGYCGLLGAGTDEYRQYLLARPCYPEDEL